MGRSRWPHILCYLQSTLKILENRSLHQSHLRSTGISLYRVSRMCVCLELKRPLKKLLEDSFQMLTFSVSAIPDLMDTTLPPLTMVAGSLVRNVSKDNLGPGRVVTSRLAFGSF